MSSAWFHLSVDRLLESRLVEWICPCHKGHGASLALSKGCGEENHDMSVLRNWPPHLSVLLSVAESCVGLGSIRVKIFFHGRVRAVI